MRNQLLLQLKQTVTRSIRILFAITISIFFLLNPAFSQTAEEQQWWFNVEFIAFKRTLLPTNNENFAKADFLMAQVNPVDLFSLNLLKRQQAMQFYIDQLPLCGTNGVDDEDVDDATAETNNVGDETNDIGSETNVGPSNIDLEANETIAKSISNTVDKTDTEIPTIDSKLNDNIPITTIDGSAIDATAINSPEPDNEIVAHLPEVFAFEQQDVVQNKLLCIQDTSSIIENENSAFQLESAPSKPTSQSITEIPVQMFADNASFNFTHSLISQAEITLEEYAQKVFRQRDIKPLLYTAWRQQVVFGEENARFYRIKAGKQLEIEEKFDYNEALARYNQAKLAETDGPEQQDNQTFFDELNEALNKKEAVDWVAEHPAPTNKQIEKDVRIAPWELDGLFKVYLDYVNQVPYLHVNTEFKHYKIQIDEKGQGQIDSYPLKQRRRIVSKQIHYFDHPAFGIIIRLERFTPPPIEAVETLD